MSKFDIYAVTGTKGKTTVVTVLSEVLREIDKKDMLRVTTLGHYVNGEQKSTLKKSIETWGLVSSVCPGRFLYECESFQEGSSAVLEASLGSSSLAGLGYGRHKVGVFLNVFKDHIGNSKRIKSQKDIVKAKQFIFSRVKHDGWAVYNADDKRVVSALRVARSTVTRISFGLTAKTRAAHHVYVKEGVVTYASPEGEQSLFNVTDVTWTFEGTFLPSVYNLLAVVAAVIAGKDGMVPEGLGEAVKRIRLDKYGGRLTLFRAKSGAYVLADYAHEENSLQAVGDLARQKLGPDGRVIGVMRMAYDRTDAHIGKTAKAIAQSYDHFIVYDKIDGHLRQPRKVNHYKFKQEVGKISGVYSKALMKYVSKGTEVEVILREDLALQRAAEITKPGDVVVHIVNDDVKRSIDWIEEFFGAELL